MTTVGMRAKHDFAIGLDGGGRRRDEFRSPDPCRFRGRRHHWSVSIGVRRPLFDANGRSRLLAVALMGGALVQLVGGTACSDGVVVPRVVVRNERAREPRRALERAPRAPRPPRTPPRTPPPPPTTTKAKPRPSRAVLKHLHVRFFSAGHGDAILLRTPSGHAVLIDAGRGNEPYLGDNLVRRRILPFCQKASISRLDAFIITHPHWDHFGDAPALVNGLAVREIFVNVDGRHVLGDIFAGLMPNVTLTQLHRGKTLQFGRLRLDVLHPPGGIAPVAVRGKLWFQNNRSLVIRATYGQHRFLLTGDLAVRGELQILRAGGAQPVRAEVLKLGHHGRGTTSVAWLRAVRPTYAVATLGDRWKKRYDELPLTLLGRLKRRHIKLFRTDLDGDIEFISDGVHLRVETHPELIRIPDWVPARRRKALLKRIAGRRRPGIVPRAQGR